VCWLPLGIALKNPAFFIMGVVFMIVGLANRKKWKDPWDDWKGLSKKERNLRLVVIVGLLAVLLLGVVALFWVGR
jgi:asparagine N-glycosylation enzyme membrane subunit Stt3